MEMSGRFKKGPLRDKDGKPIPGNWDLVETQGRWGLYVVCEFCMHILNLDCFIPDPNGALNPCVWCSQCDTHWWAYLSGWTSEDNVRLSRPSSPWSSMSKRQRKRLLFGKSGDKQS